MKDYSNYHVQSKDKINYDGNKLFTLHLQGYEGCVGTIDGVENEFLIQKHISVGNEFKDKSKIACLSSIILNRGSIVDADGVNYITLSDVNDNGFYKDAEIQKTNNTLKFYTKSNENSLSWEIPCIVGNVSVGNEDNKYIKTVDNEVPLVVSNNEITRKIKPDDIYKIGMYNYQIISVPDDISIPGLLQFKLKYIETEQPLPSYSIEILNGEAVSIQRGNNIQLNVQVKDGSEILTTLPPYLFISSDENILTVNSEGFVASLSAGSAIVTCRLQSDESVYDTISITVEEIPVVDNYTIIISGADSIKINQSGEYIAKLYNNGVEVTSDNYIWSLSNSYATITSQNSTNCMIKAGSTSGKTVLLKATKSDNTSIFAEKTITITGLW